MRRKFIIDPAIAALFPTLQVGVILVRGIHNQTASSEAFASLLAEGIQAAHGHLQASEFSANPVVATWREAFKRFKTKKGARCSIEALLKRISNGNPVGTINPLVDLYNFVSLKHAVPCGGEDLGALQGDLELTLAQGGEGFLPLGAEADDPALPGEVIYKDGAGAVCRCFNWREAQRTMLTDQTTDAILVLEEVDGARSQALEAAVAELSELVRTHLGGHIETHLLRGAAAFDLDA